MPLIDGFVSVAVPPVVLVVGAAGVTGATANAVAVDCAEGAPNTVEVAVKLWLPIAMAVVVWNVQLPELSAVVVPT